MDSQPPPSPQPHTFSPEFLQHQMEQVAERVGSESWVIMDREEKTVMTDPTPTLNPGQLKPWSTKFRKRAEEVAKEAGRQKKWYGCHPVTLKYAINRLMDREIKKLN